MNTSTSVSPYQSDILQSFSLWYSKCHGYISLVICAVGIALNIITIIVLTRKQMQTPINFILTWLAVFDIATMMSYMPFAFHFYCQFSAVSISPRKNSLSWMNFLLVYLNFSSTTHTISIWLAVALAIFRHRHIHSHSNGSLTRMRRLIRARVVVCVIVFASIIIMVPNYLSYKLEERQFTDNTSVYVFEDWELGSEQTQPLTMIALLLYSTVAKLTPSVIIIIYGSLLLRTLRKSVKIKRRLSEGGVSLSYHRNTNPSRTTVMLLIVIVLFLVTELPQGILIMCCIFLETFFEHVYIPLGDVMDILALINNSINFILYCTMSHEFRRTFMKLVCSFQVASQRPNSYIPTQLRNKRQHLSQSQTGRNVQGTDHTSAI